MPSIIPGYEYEIFISYRQNDNKRDGWVTEFVQTSKEVVAITLNRRIHRCFQIVLLILFSAGNLLAQTNLPNYTIPSLTEEIILDGKINEEAWEKIEPLNMTSHWPEYGRIPGKKSEIKVAYSEQYIYLAAILYEDLNQIQESSFKRDENWSLRFDQLAIMLDTYNDAENGLFFVVSPSGARGDQTIRNDALESRYFNNSWNTFWDAEVSYFEKGWQAEVRIPFSSLRFNTKNNLTEMGMIVYRYSAHDKIMDIFPVVSNEYGFFSFAKPSLSQDISFKDIQYKRPVYLTPFILGNSSRIHELDEINQRYKMEKSDEFSAGFDLQYALSNSLNMDVSFNTDFAQVEADNQQVNLTRFSLFFPEKRKFFQERSSTFEFNFDRNNKLFYSRKIGLKSGDIVPLWGGVRFVGRSGKYDFGILNMQAKDTDINDTENYGVIRFRRDIFNENSYLGGMLTSVINRNGNYNLGYGLDALINVIGDEYMRVNFSQTYGDADEDSVEINSWNRSRLFLEWQKRKNIGFGYQLNFNHVGDFYNPELGFEERKNYWLLGDKIFYNFWMKEESSLQKVDLTLESNVFVSHQRNEIESSLISPEVEVVGKNEFILNATVDMLYDHPYDSFYISDEIFVVPGEYRNNTLGISYTTPRINLYSFTFNYSYGSFYGGTIHSPKLTFGYLPSKYLQFNFDYEYDNIRLPGFSEFKSQLGRLEITGALNVKWTLSTFLQYNSSQNIWALNSRLRFNPKDGVNLYVVYNENFNSDLNRENPALPRSDSHSFVIKYSHTFNL